MPGPTFVRPPTPDTGETGRRAAFDTLANRRLVAPGYSVDQRELLDAFVRSFVDAVERANSTRALLRQDPLDYVDAVLLDGEAGQLVVDAVDYDAAPVYWQAKVGGVSQLVHGADLDAYLRTGETRYAERLGLA